MIRMPTIRTLASHEWALIGSCSRAHGPMRRTHVAKCAPVALDIGPGTGMRWITRFEMALGADDRRWTDTGHR
jgi:hypothetical protein